MMRFSTVLVVVASALASAGSAGAATVSVVLHDPDPVFAEWRLIYEAAPEEDNFLTIGSLSGTAGPTGTWIVREKGGLPITAGAGCTSADTSTAVCSVPAGASELFLHAVVDLGDMDDRAHATGACGSEIDPTDFLCGTTIDGGPGQDWITGALAGETYLKGGDAEDFLDAGGVFSGVEADDDENNLTILEGGPGPDHLRGNNLFDRVSYAERAADVRVTLDGRANDGEAGEGDELVGITQIATGSGDDVVAGNSGPNVILTGAGRDTVSAGWGPDSLYGGPGRDFLRGSRGHDSFSDRDGFRDVLEGGKGSDFARADRGLDVLTSIERRRLR